MRLLLWWARLTSQPVYWLEFADELRMAIAKPHPDGKQWLVTFLSVSFRVSVDGKATRLAYPDLPYVGGWVIPPAGGKSEAQLLDEALAECDRLLAKIRTNHESYRSGK